MSKFSQITGTIGLVLMFITIGVFDSSIPMAIVCFVLSCIFCWPCIAEDRALSDNEEGR